MRMDAICRTTGAAECAPLHQILQYSALQLPKGAKPAGDYHNGWTDGRREVETPTPLLLYHSYCHYHSGWTAGMVSPSWHQMVPVVSMVSRSSMTCTACTAFVRQKA